MTACLSLNPTFQTHLQQRAGSIWAVRPVGCKRQSAREFQSLYWRARRRAMTAPAQPFAIYGAPLRQGHNVHRLSANHPLDTHSTHRVSSTFRNNA